MNEGNESAPTVNCVSIVIVAYNDAERLDACITSLAKYEGPEVSTSVLVVDHSSSDAVRLMMGEHHPNVSLIQSANAGYGAGNNRGASLTDGDIILFLNPDTKLRRPILRHLVQEFNMQPELGAMGVQLVYPDGRPQQSFFWAVSGGVWKGLAQHIATRFGLFHAGSMCTSGAALAVRRSAFANVGGFDDEFFLYCEEPDLWKRLTGAGWKWGFDGSVSIVHVGGTATPDPIVSTERRLSSLQILCRKYGIDYRAQLRKELRYLRFVSLARQISRRRDPASRMTYEGIRLAYETALAPPIENL